MRRVKPSQSEPSHARGRRQQWRWSLLATAVVVLAVFGAFSWRGAAFAPSGHPAPTPESSSPPVAPTPSAPDSPGTSPSPSATPMRAAEGAFDDDAVQALMNQYLQVSTAMTSHTDSVAQDLGDVADRPIIEEVEAQLRELESQGWSQTGTPTIVSSRILEVDEAAGTAEVELCLDSSEVELLDYDGTPLPSSIATRALNLYSLKQHDGDAWIIASHSFPHDPSC